jgi:hypothetical protein
MEFTLTRPPRYSCDQLSSAGTVWNTNVRARVGVRHVGQEVDLAVLELRNAGCPRARDILHRPSFGDGHLVEHVDQDPGGMAVPVHEKFGRVAVDADAQRRGRRRVRTTDTREHVEQEET